MIYLGLVDFDGFNTLDVTSANTVTINENFLRQCIVIVFPVLPVLMINFDSLINPL